MRDIIYLQPDRSVLGLVGRFIDIDIWGDPDRIRAAFNVLPWIRQDQMQSVLQGRSWNNRNGHGWLIPRLTGRDKMRVGAMATGRNNTGTVWIPV
jgi:hypothetical protein